jgi:hypothetical protein
MNLGGILFIQPKKKYSKTMSEWTWVHLGEAYPHSSDPGCAKSVSEWTLVCQSMPEGTWVHSGSHGFTSSLHDKKCELKNWTKSAQATGLTNASQLSACYSTCITKHSHFVQQACKQIEDMLTESWCPCLSEPRFI